MRNHISFLISLLFVFCLFSLSNSYAQQVEFAKSFSIKGKLLLLLDDGNSIYAGPIKNTYSGNYIISIKKLDDQGRVVWEKRMEANAKIHAKTIAFDEKQENIYLLGDLHGNVSLEEENSDWIFDLDRPHLFLMKMNIHGEILWTKMWEGLAIYADLSVSQTGKIYVTGQVLGANPPIDLDPGPDSLITDCASSDCAYISKFDKHGNLIWNRITEGGVWGTWFFDMTCDNQYIYVLGGADENLSLDGYSGPIEFDQESNDFIFKFNSSGDLVWYKKMGLISDGYAHEIVLDSEKNIILTGFFSDTSTFDNEEIIGKNKAMQFVVKYDKNGDLQWLNHSITEGSGENYPSDIAIDSNDNIYVSGGIKGSLHYFDAENLQHPLSSTSYTEYDGYIQKIEPNGKIVGLYHFPNDKRCYISQIKIDDLGNLYATGDFYHNLFFNDQQLISENSESSFGFVLKFQPDPFLKVEETKTNLLPTIFPNPALKMINLKFYNLNDHIKVSQYTLTGQLIHSENYNKVNAINFDVKGDKGVYLISVDNFESTTYWTKVVKQ